MTSATTLERLRSLSPERFAALAASLTPRTNRYIPHAPTVRQAAFLLLPTREAFYGGAAGGGKSDALLMAALQYADVPGYAALLLRRSFADLSLPGALLDRSRDWLASTDAKWSHDEKTWHFPGGGSLTFGYLERAADVYRYQSAEFQFIGFDELTQFSEWQFRYLFSRLRRLEGSNIPVRMRSASNPGNTGHDWVKMRYVEPRSKERPFVPARLADNPYLDRDGYAVSLAELDPFTRRQLLEGDWTARSPGGKFRREWFELVEAAPVQAERCRYWDLAATAPKPGTDPDWTAGARVSCTRDGIWHVEDMRRMRGSPLQVEQLVRQTAELDGRGCTIWIEQEPGASGKSTIDHYVRNVLRGYTVRGHAPTGPKDVRANPVSSQAEAGNVKIVRGGWVPAYLDELESFAPDCSHDDQVDATSGAFAMLTRRGFSAADAIRAMEAH